MHHRVKKNSNGIAAAHSGRNGFAVVDQEFAALDDCGPLVRRVLTEGPMPILAVPVVAQIIAKNDEIEKKNEEREQQGLLPLPYLDLHDPRLDKFLAEQLLNFHLDLMKDSTPDRAADGLKPLVGTRSAKSAREQAKSERLARRYMRR